MVSLLLYVHWISCIVFPTHQGFNELGFTVRELEVELRYSNVKV